MGREGRPWGGKETPFGGVSFPPQTPPILPELSSAGFDSECVSGLAVRGVTEYLSRTGESNPAEESLGVVWRGGLDASLQPKGQRITQSLKVFEDSKETFFKKFLWQGLGQSPKVLRR